MNIEHIAFNVPEPAKMADWYVRNLAMRVQRHVGGPTQTHFLADQAGRVMIEIYRQQVAPVPDYASMDPMVLHIAFAVPDVAAAQKRLVAAGATAVGDVATTPTGDTLAMLRDPWGVPVQLVKRAKPLAEG